MYSHNLQYNTFPTIAIPFFYENEVLSHLMFDGGFYTFDSDSLSPQCHYYFTDHLGSVRVVTDSQGNIEQTNNYYPYGGLMASSSTIYSPSSSTAANQPNRYNGKELDRKNNLDWSDYGARHFDGIVWRNVDKLTEKYPSWSSYVYCMGNPIKSVDPDGREVFAADYLARRNIINTLNREESQYIRFNENGRLDVELLNQYAGFSDNFHALRTLANSETNYIFAVANQDINGKEFFELESNKGLPENYSYGITNMPGMTESPSPNDNVYIFTASFLDEKRQAINTAHEGYGHAYFFELSKHNTTINPNHTSIVVGGRVEYDSELQMDNIIIIFKRTNTLLEKQIKIVEEQASKNYEERNH